MALVGMAKCSVDNGGNKIETGEEKQLGERDAKLFNVFTVVRFPNDPCPGSSNQNGTCYTDQECRNKNGQNAGSCAQGFGVCCVFVATCGASLAENCTYFTSNGGESAGACTLEICPCSSGICQMRLDFTNFVITGPSALTTTVGKEINGVVTTAAAGIAYSLQTQCLTDTFTVRGQNTGENTPPTICGINTGDHMYAEMDENNCNSLDFQLGAIGVGATVPTRSWTIKVTQIECNSDIRAPQGCTQYFYGQNTDVVRSYNFNGGSGIHLARQNQNICVRRESGRCQICWTAMDPTDVDTNGKGAAQKGGAGGTPGYMCCSYMADGMGTLGYDCLVIPGAKVGTASATLNAAGAERFCGESKGLATLAAGDDAATASKTICTKQEPFSIQFISDQIESANEALDDATAGKKTGSGFQVAYFQTSNC